MDPSEFCRTCFIQHVEEEEEDIYLAQTVITMDMTIYNIKQRQVARKPQGKQAGRSNTIS